MTKPVTTQAPTVPTNASPPESRLTAEQQRFAEVVGSALATLWMKSERSKKSHPSADPPRQSQG